MFLDMVAQDKKTLSALVSAREKDRGPGYPLPFLELDGNGVGNLLCEASITAKQLGSQKFGDAMWEKALRLAPLSTCVKNNWPLMYGKPSSYDAKHGVWEKIRMMVHGGVQHEVTSRNEPAIRFQGNTKFRLMPWNRTHGE